MPHEPGLPAAPHWGTQNCAIIHHNHLTRNHDHGRQQKQGPQAALAQIEKQFGKGSIMKMGEARSRTTSRPSPPARSASTSRWASAACRAAAWSKSTARNPRARPRFACTSSPRSEARRRRRLHRRRNALDPIYAGKLGVNVADLLISQPDTGEQALEIADMLVRSGGVDIVVIDSVAGAGAEGRNRGRDGRPVARPAGPPDEPGAAQADRQHQAHQHLVIFINQIRMKIGVMFGNPETTTGGNALKFYASVRLDIRRTGAIKGRRGDRQRPRSRSSRTRWRRRSAKGHFDILYGEGISREGEIIELGVEHKIVEKSGAWYAYNGEKIGQGKDNTREYLREHPQTPREIEKRCARAVGVALGAAAESGEGR